MERADKWQTNLAAVCVTAQHERDSLTCSSRPQLIDIIRRMTHQNDGLAGTVLNGRRDCPLRIGLTADRIVDARQPKPRSLPLDRHKGVSKHCDSVGTQGITHLLLACKDVMVPKDCVTISTFDLVEQFAALPCRFNGQRPWKHLSTHIISSEQNDIRLGAVDFIDRCSHQKWLCEFIEMYVAHLSDCHAIERRSQPLDFDFFV